MPGSKSTNVIDGFASVQAVRRQRARGPGHARAVPEPPRKPEPPKPRNQARIGHTVVPTRHEIICYECDYAFTMSGRLDTTICPKCHEQLLMRDETITGAWAAPIRTIGTVDIQAGAVMKGADIIATDVILAGDARGATIRACRRLELCQGAAFDVSLLRVRDLLIRRGNRIVIKDDVVCRDLMVEGELKAQVFTKGTTTIAPGGLLRGAFRGAHLIVQEGGGLMAKIALDPSASPETNTSDKPKRWSRKKAPQPE